MAVRIAALAALLCLLAFALAAREQPRKSSPSALEKTCLYRGNALPCFILDEALQTTWSV